MMVEPRTYQSKIVYNIQAIQYTGEPENIEAIKKFVGDRDNGDCLFMLPSEINGIWRDAHLWYNRFQYWVSIKKNDWIVLDKTTSVFYHSTPKEFSIYEEQKTR